MPTPRNEGQSLNQFNDQLRAHPEYQAFLRSIGANPNGALRLSGAQRSQAERFVRSKFPDLPGKFQIDPAGNVNTDHGLSTAWSNPYFRYPLLAAGALGTAGALGAFGGAAGAAGTGGGAGAGAGAGAAGGVSAGVGALGGAGMPGGALYGAAPPSARGGLGGIFSKLGGGVTDALFSKQGAGALAAMIPALMAMKGGPFGGGPDPNVTRGMDLTEKAYADAQRLNAMKEARFRRVDPLHEAVTQLAFNRMPTTNGTNGINLTRVPLPE